MADIFISHKSEEQLRSMAYAREFRSLGYTVWVDQRIHAGAHWDREIEREIRAACAVVVLWSRQSRDSDWVRNEARLGLQEGKLVPVRIEHCELPLEFTGVQTADIFDLAKFQRTEAWELLLDRIDQLVGRSRPARGFEPADPLAPARPEPAQAKQKPVLQFLTLALLAVIAVILFGMYSSLTTRGTAEPVDGPVTQSSSTTATADMKLPPSPTPEPTPVVTPSTVEASVTGWSSLPVAPVVPAPVRNATWPANGSYRTFTIYFAYDGVLRESDEGPIDEATRYMAANPEQDRISVIGHTDDRAGSSASTIAGSMAQQVADALAARGIARERLDVMTGGSRYPAAFGNDKSVWAQNRRVDILVY